MSTTSRRLSWNWRRVTHTWRLLALTWGLVTEQGASRRGWPGVDLLLPLLRDRRSVRDFDPDHVLDDAALTSLLEAARWAPSAGNSQPWAFLVGRRGEATHAGLVDVLAPSVRRWAPAASALLVTLHRTAADASDGSPAYSDYAAYDLGQAVAHLTVQAAHLGLATHQFAAFDHDRLAAQAAVPAHWAVSTGVAVGRSLTADLTPRRRQPLTAFCFGARFGEPAAP